MSWLSSVRGRITIVVTVVFAVAMTLGGWLLLQRAEQAWIDDLEAADFAELEMLAQDLQAIEAITSDEFFLPAGVDGTNFGILDAGGEIIAQTPGLIGGTFFVEGEIPFDEIPPEILEGGSFVPDGEVTLVTMPLEMSGGIVTLTASSSLEPVRAGVDSLRDLLLAAIPLLVVGVGATSWWVTGRAFRPVEAITDQVGRITDDRLDERVPVPSSRDEVSHLARTMNRMLDRLSASRRRQREFVSDASHELRNPIATSRTKLEVALSHPEQTDWTDTAEVVLAEQERLSSLVDSLLELARLDEGAPTRTEHVDLDDIVFAEAKRVADRADVSVADVAPVQVDGDGRQITHAVRNLIDNAARHAESRVVITLRADGNEAVLVVDDDGEGIPAEMQTEVFDRFVRIDESRRRGSGGAGLGLALVAAVAAAHGGSATASESEWGGARLVLRLPKSTSPRD